VVGFGVVSVLQACLQHGYHSKPNHIVHLFCNLSQVYPAVLLMYFICAAVILLASLALTDQVSLPYNKTGRASVLYSFTLVFLRIC